MTSFKKRSRHARFQGIMGTIFVLPVIAVLGFLDVIPVSNTLAWFALAAFVIGLIVLAVSFKGKNPANET